MSDGDTSLRAWHLRSFDLTGLGAHGYDRAMRRTISSAAVWYYAYATRLTGRG